jgi:hypothetical protein
MMPEERYVDDGQEGEETTSDKFYYSMEELFRHKDTSMYE